MAKLVTVDKLKARLGLLNDSPEEILLKVSSVLDATTTYLSSLLRTGFDRQLSEELYHINPMEEPRTLDFIQLYLPNGFVHEDEAANPNPIITTIVMSDTMLGLVNSDVINQDYIIVEKVKGLVMVDMSYADSYLFSNLTDKSDKFFMKATYTSGFETLDTSFGYVYVGVPEWLQEAAILQAMALYNGNCNNTTQGNCPKDVLLLLERYIRFYPTARKGLM